MMIKTAIANTLFKSCSQLTVMILLLASGCSGSPGTTGSASTHAVSENSAAKIEFSDYSHDFGKVTQGEKLSFIFTFENKGTGNLLIYSAEASCGCTVPRYDRKPVPPGGHGNIEVIFDTSDRSGKQTKTVQVKSNASKPVVLLQITAEVGSEMNK
jgi:Protein of unknown function (DUF1573)